MQVTTPACGAIVMALLDVWVGARYCIKLIRGLTYPRIATWLIFEIGIIMSLAAYFTSHNHSLVKDVLNVTDAAVVTGILVSLFIEQRSRRIVLTRNEQLCLVISFITLAAWAITKTAWIGFAGFQAVMSVAYFPTLENVWQWKPTLPPEPAETWSINAVAALIGVGIDVTGTHHDYVAMLYPLRAFILCVIVVILVERWKYKNKRSPALIG